VTTEKEPGAARPYALLVGGAVLTAAAVLAFLVLDPILAAFLASIGLTALGIAVMARDWDEHSTFEERELARARKRKEKWERNAGTRARDRARWEAHQAKQAEQAKKADQ
jgi:hypothetical protein